MDTSITTEADLPVSTCSKRSILAHHNKAAATSLTSSIANTASSSLSNSSNAFVSGKMESEMMAEEQAGMVMLSTTSVKPSESSGNGERDDDSKLTAAGLSLNKPHIHAAIQWYAECAVLIRLARSLRHVCPHFHTVDDSRRMQATYVASPAHNISREEIYQDYVKFATEQNMEVMNMATFGKVTRVVFPDIKTRRLGVRGNSRYNYMGVRARVEGEMGDGVPNPTDNVVGRNVESEVVAYVD